MIFFIIFFLYSRDVIISTEEKNETGTKQRLVCCAVRVYFQVILRRLIVISDRCAVLRRLVDLFVHPFDAGLQLLAAFIYFVTVCC